MDIRPAAMYSHQMSHGGPIGSSTTSIGSYTHTSIPMSGTSSYRTMRGPIGASSGMPAEYLPVSPQGPPMPHHIAQQQQQQQQHIAPIPIKGKRKRASPQQLEVLNRVFSSTSFPSTDMRNRLARELGMTPRTVQIWFQNKRQASRQRDGHNSRNSKSIRNSTPPSKRRSTAPLSPLARTNASNEGVGIYSLSPPVLSASVSSPLDNSGDGSFPSSSSPSTSSPCSYPQHKGMGRPHGLSSPQEAGNILPPITTRMAPHAEPLPSTNPNPNSYYDDEHMLGSIRHNAQYTVHDHWFKERGRLDHELRGTIARPMGGLEIQRNAPHRSYSTMSPMHGAQKPVVFGAAAEVPASMPVQRSMSLLDMLNAPPEQRKLPPLPIKLP